MGIFLSVLIAITIISFGSFFYLTGQPLPTSFDQVKAILLIKDPTPPAPAKASTISTLPKTIVLAGKVAQLLEFRKADYLEALNSEKTILLYSTTKTCFICRNELDILKQIFDESTSKNLIGFRVNLSNNGKDPFQKKITAQFTINIENTKVFIKDGALFSKSTDSWDKDRYLLELGNIRS